MEALESVLSLVVTLGILVTIHEYGHYWVARRCGVKVLRFSVGFGRPLYTWHNKEGTEFCVASIPLGGYVKMLDEREGDVPEEEKLFAFNRQSVSQRIAIASAGPIANFLFAIFAYFLLAMIGFNVLKPMIGEVEPDSISADSGLYPGLVISAVDGRDVNGWRDVNLALINFVGETAQIDLQTLDESNGAIRSHALSVESWLTGRKEKDFLKSLGIQPWRPHIPAKMGLIQEGSPANKGGLLVGDEVLQANGQSIDSWFDLVAVIEGSANIEMELLVARKGDSGLENTLLLKVTPEGVSAEDGSTQGRLGVGVSPFEYPQDMIRTVQLGPVDAVFYGLEQTWSDTVMTLNAIRKMIVGLLSLENLSGPITIAQVASQSISSGVESFLGFLALLSVSLGVLNLLPIPVLDGGHILYYLLEGLRGKPIPESWQVLGLKIGISFVVALMAIAFYNDIMRL